MKFGLIFGVFGALSVWADTGVPGILMEACDNVPEQAKSSFSQGGRFSVDEEDAGCDVQGVYADGMGCMALENPGEAGFGFHTKNWTESKGIGGWKIQQVSGGVVLGVPKDEGNCLEGGNLGEAPISAVCDASNEKQVFVVDGTNQLLRLGSNNSMCLSWGTPSPPPPSAGTFTIQMGDEGLRQVVEGVEFELQCDSIGSDNSGMPSTISGVPHDLTESERVRFNEELLKGFRFGRLAMGLFLRGLDAQNRTIQGRWPTQMSELKALQDGCGMEGWMPEYWSPAPFWKSTKSFYTGTLASFNETFLGEFAKNYVKELTYLEANGLNVSWVGLQNEPNFDRTNITNCSNDRVFESSNVDVSANSYSRCAYTQCSYYEAFRVVAPILKQWKPSVRIHANSATGSDGASAIFNDPKLVKYVDAWTWHFIDASGSEFVGVNYSDSWHNIPSWDNEYEYQPESPFAGTMTGAVNTANFFLLAYALELEATPRCGRHDAVGPARVCFRNPRDWPRWPSPPNHSLWSPRNRRHQH